MSEVLENALENAMFILVFWPVKSSTKSFLACSKQDHYAPQVTGLLNYGKSDLVSNQVKPHVYVLGTQLWISNVTIIPCYIHG